MEEKLYLSDTHPHSACSIITGTKKISEICFR